MPKLFEDNQNYILGDKELGLIGDREKLAQWRHKGMGPAFYRLGRKIVYHGADLNTWAEANRVEAPLPAKNKSPPQYQHSSASDTGSNAV